MGNLCWIFNYDSESSFPPSLVTLMLLIMPTESPGGPHMSGLDYKRKTVFPQVGAGYGQHSRQRDLRGRWKESSLGKRESYERSS